MSSENYETPIKIKLVLFGPEQSGKTSILLRFVNDTFRSIYRATIGADFLSKNYLIDGSGVYLQLWDMAGQERFKSLGISFMKDTNAVGIVLSHENYQDVKKYYKEARSHVPEAPIYFIINKIDEEKTPSREALINCIKQAVPDDEFDESHILLCSAKTGEGVDNAFIKIVTDVCTHLKNTGQLNLSDDRSEESDESSIKLAWLAFIDNVEDFFSEHKIWMGGNAALIAGIIITLVVLATLPVGGALVLGLPLTTLALAGIIGGASFLLWNVVCAIGNWWMGPQKPSSYNFESDDEDDQPRSDIQLDSDDEDDQSQPIPQPETYKNPFANPDTQNNHTSTPTTDQPQQRL